MRILVVEDNPDIAGNIGDYLEAQGYILDFAMDGIGGLHLALTQEYEAIVLDVMLPGMDGFAFCRRVRNEGDRVPILFLTARSGGQDRIKGLDEGGDDYITKPFDLAELLARIKSLFRRQDWFRGQETPSSLRIGKAEVNLRAYQAVTDEGTIGLKEKEVMILRLLSEHAGEPVDRETILDRVWGFGAYPTTRTVDNFILGLRKIVETDPRKPRHILTVHGVGYRLVTDPDGDGRKD